MENQQSAVWDSLRNLKKSATDKKIAGVVEDLASTPRCRHGYGAHCF